MKNKYKPYSTRRKVVRIWTIPVRVLKNTEDWEFVFRDNGKGVKGMTVF